MSTSEEKNQRDTTVEEKRLVGKETINLTTVFDEISNSSLSVEDKKKAIHAALLFGAIDHVMKQDEEDVKRFCDCVDEVLAEYDKTGQPDDKPVESTSDEKAIKRDTINQTNLARTKHMAVETANDKTGKPDEKTVETADYKTKTDQPIIGEKRKNEAGERSGVPEKKLNRTIV